MNNKKYTNIKKTARINIKMKQIKTNSIYTIL